MTTTLETPAPPIRRLQFVDNLRIVLISLVVLHHVACVYSGLPAWYYTERPTSPVAGLVLTVFLLVNQAWFMGAFFLLSGYFTPASYDRKGPRAFLRDRLGVPLVVFYFILNPLLYLGTHQSYVHTIGTGPLWFVLALLVMDTSYAGWRHLTRNRPPIARPLTFRAVLAFVLVLALVTYAVRCVLTMGFWIPVIDFPTGDYLPQYIGFFAVGTLAFRRGWLQTLSGRMGWKGLALAAGATIVFLPVALGGDWSGHGTVSSLFYALWDPSFAVGLVLALLVLFRRRFAGQGRLGRHLSAQVFAVYVFHAFVVTAVARALGDAGLPSLLKFAVAAVIVLPVSFLMAGLIRRLPGARRIL